MALGRFIPWFTFWLTCLGFAAACAADSLDFATAIDKAGRQRMLTQRITKTYMQIGLGAKIEQSREQLRQAIELFEEQHSELKSFASTVELNEALLVIEALWEPFKGTALTEPNKTTARRLNEMDDRLLDACESVVYLFQDIADTDYTNVVNMAGRQRMLSQRLAKFYMALASDLGSPSMLSRIDRAKNEFMGALVNLKRAPLNTPAIAAKLEEVEQQWLWLESSLDIGEAYYPLLVVDASEKILELMDTVTGMYAKLSSES